MSVCAADLQELLSLRPAFHQSINGDRLIFNSYAKHHLFCGRRTAKRSLQTRHFSLCLRQSGLRSVQVLSLALTNFRPARANSLDGQMSVHDVMIIAIFVHHGEGLRRNGYPL